MPLPYNNAVPQGAQTIASTQAPILTNFQSIDAAFNETGGNNFTKYRMQAPLATDPVTAVNEGAVFLKTSNTKTELFYERDTGTAGAPAIPLTHLSMIKAWASFNGFTPGLFVPANSFNITSVNRIASGVYDIILAANAVINVEFGILATGGQNGVNTGFIGVFARAFAATVGTFTLRTQPPGTSLDPISFMVFQL